MLTDRLIKTLQTFAVDMTSDYLAIEKLDQLMVVAAEELAVDGCGAMLADDEGVLRFVSSSDERTRLIEQFQIEEGEGPCVMAAQSGELVITDSLRTGDDRFPRFARRAAAAGMYSVYSFPMIIEDHSFGALNLYRDKPGSVSVEQRAAGTTFANIATTYLMSARRIDQATDMVSRLRAAMDRNAPIEQAKGYVAGVRHIEPTEAFELIRRYARANRLRIDDVARQLVGGVLQISALDHDGS
ncbi:GAF and ANTAR domain-containing protein [Euzebya tangerina]|uniref:GAF and ANTAR domain-containing protein n=1 Tax=Euzebya tangerina TaxID=591198 RepID=UPI0013C37343|nr:GAF and ANTAR domain-containing protein [Euzebya tangerina]